MHRSRYWGSLVRTDLNFDLSLDLDLYFGGRKIKIVITQSFLKLGDNLYIAINLPTIYCIIYNVIVIYDQGQIHSPQPTTNTSGMPSLMGNLTW